MQVHNISILKFYCYDVIFPSIEIYYAQHVRIKLCNLNENDALKKGIIQFFTILFLGSISKILSGKCSI